MPSLPATAEELTSIAQILHLAHHRNKNQHRLAKWYKSFSQLRRQTSKFLLELQELDTAVTFTAKGKENKYVKAAREKVEARVRFWEERLFERWFVAFSNLTADNQYATLGLMVLGCLARLRRVVRPFGREIEEDEDGGLAGEASKAVHELMGGARDDVGEVVKRGDIDTSGSGKKRPEMNSDNGEDEEVAGLKRSKKKKRRTRPEESSKEKAVESTPSKRPKKRKKGDAFDDIFSSLI